MSVAWWIAAGVLAVASFVVTRSGMATRVAAAALVLCLMLLAAPPTIPWPDRAEHRLSDNASLATMESTLDGASPAATVQLSGHGVHPELLPVLGERGVQLVDPSPIRGVTELRWPRRIVAGVPFEVSGHIGTRDSTVVRLQGPDGRVDSVRTDSAFAFTVAGRAAGRWAWELDAHGERHTLGVHVEQPPHLRVLVIAGRPDFEVPSLVRHLEAQGASITVQTRINATELRREQFGIEPPATRPTRAQLDSLDLVVLAQGGYREVSGDYAQTLRAAADSGLGVLLLEESALSAGPLVPMTLRAAGTERRAIPRMDGVAAGAPVTAPPVRVEDAEPAIADTAGAPLAWFARVGNGAVGYTAVATAHRLSLHGHPEDEASWWAALLGPLVRKGKPRWEMAPDALVRVDLPLEVRWSGMHRPDATIGTTTPVAASDDSLPLRLWPSDTGWMSIVGGGDTTFIHAGAPDAFAGVEAKQRVLAARNAAAPSDGPSPWGRRPLPRLIPLLLLLVAAVPAWRR